MARTMPRVAADAMPACLLVGAATAESTASRPATAGTSASSSVRSQAVTTVSSGWATASRAGSLTTAVTWWPASRAWRTRRQPVPPVAPNTVSRIAPLEGG